MTRFYRNKLLEVSKYLQDEIRDFFYEEETGNQKIQAFFAIFDVFEIFLIIFYFYVKFHKNFNGAEFVPEFCNPVGNYRVVTAIN